jgi:small subunit ribosomal protein S1
MESNLPVGGDQQPNEEPIRSDAVVGEAASQPATPAQDTPPQMPVDSLEDQAEASAELSAGDETPADLPAEGGDAPQVRKGQLVEGVITQTSPNEVIVDLGLKLPGIISSKELERMDKETIEALKVGEKITAFVVTPENRNGYVVLSIGRAMEEQDWRHAEEMRESGQIFSGKVDGYNKGGLIVRFGRVRGFVPESQVSRDRRTRATGSDPQAKWAEMRGEEIAVRVVEVDRGRNRLILSERDAAPANREKSKERLLGELNVGDVRTGKVKSVADFGAFVDVGGADGLVHLTEISWKHVTHPSQVLKVGQEVEVEVINIDRERKRIGLSIRRREEDPWLVIARNYQIDQLVQGTITKLTKFGAFARLVDAQEIEGLIHISELGQQRVNHPRDVVAEGDVLTLRVVKIDSDERRLGLSLKRVSSPEYMDADLKRARRDTTAASTGGDIADFEAASLKENDRRRRGKKGKSKRGDDDYGDEY